MSAWSWIGNISLNVSFILYLIVYIPQIIHNRKTVHLAHLSLGLHSCLFLSYTFDLIYGFASHLPWQYKTVSVVGLLMILIQHTQLMRLFIQNQRRSLIKLGILFLVLNSLAIGYFFIINGGALTPQNTLILGVLARIYGLLYSLPQIIKNHISKTTNAISRHFIYLNLTLTLLDSISAWSLNWGWPNKLAAPVSAVLMLTLLFQSKSKAKGHQFSINLCGKLSNRPA
jgi:uncharacterized protein with PQ loop repeat